MISSRGWWFLVICSAVLALGLLGNRFTLILLGLTLLLWFLAEWLRFRWHILVVRRGLTVQRELTDERGVVDVLWAGHVFRVRVVLRLESWFNLSYLRLGDRIPFGTELVGGSPGAEGKLIAGGNPIRFEYEVRCLAAGRVRFEGVKIEITDLQGFFFHAGFVHDPVLYPVLPALRARDRRATMLKRVNAVPVHGIHRFRRPGSGSELLDLRDYRPGDPPKTIAWKISARRDRLITKEFESEVPVRCTLFVDTSNAVRLGPPGQNALAHLVGLAAAIAQADAEAKDWTGLCVFHETGVSAYLRPARGSRHMLHMLNVLADAAGSTPAIGEARLDQLLPLANAFAEEVYPEQLRPEINQFPRWLPWLSPKPAFTTRHPSLADRLYGWLPIWAVTLGLVLIGLAAASIWGLVTVLPQMWRRITPEIALSLALLLWLLMLPALRSLPLFFPRRRQRDTMRKRLAAFLSVRYGLAPGGLSLLMEDDERFAAAAQRFLAEHHVPYPLPLYDRRGHYLFASPGKVDVLAHALLHAVGRGHDNELFVLLVDLLELPDKLEPLLRAVKVALARHHQVMILCPWPPEVELPEGRRRDAADSPRSHESARRPRGGRKTQPLAEVLLRATTVRLHQAFFHLRRTFAHLGIVVLCAREGDPARLVLDRLNRLRAAGRRRR